MLQFLLKKLPNIKQRHRFLCKTIILSAGMHCILLCIALLIERFSSHVFVLKKENMHEYRRIVLIPLARRITDDMLANKQKEDVKIKEENGEIEIQEKLAVMQFAEKPPKIVEISQQDIPEKIQEFPEEPQQIMSKKEKESAQTLKDETTYVGRDDLQELKLYKTIFSAIEKEWQPPVGLPADSACEIAFVVKEGKAHTIEILKSSKIAAYDIAARCAVARAHFARQAYGKKCTVVFKL